MFGRKNPKTQSYATFEESTGYTSERDSITSGTNPKGNKLIIYLGWGRSKLLSKRWAKAFPPKGMNDES